MDQQYYKQKKILLVYDEKALLDMVADFLREDGYTQIKTAGTVAAGPGPTACPPSWTWPTSWGSAAPSSGTL